MHIRNADIHLSSVMLDRSNHEDKCKSEWPDTKELLKCYKHWMFLPIVTVTPALIIFVTGLRYASSFFQDSHYIHKCFWFAQPLTAKQPYPFPPQCHALSNHPNKGAKPENWTTQCGGRTLCSTSHTTSFIKRQTRHFSLWLGFLAQTTTAVPSFVKYNPYTDGTLHKLQFCTLNRNIV